MDKATEHSLAAEALFENRDRRDPGKESALLAEAQAHALLAVAYALGDLVNRAFPKKPAKAAKR